MLRSRFRLIALVLLVPLLVVLGSAWLVVREDGNRAKSRAAATLNTLLQDMARRSDTAQKTWTEKLETLASPLIADHAPETLRSAIEREPLIRMIAVLDRDGVLIFPDPAAPSLREREFLDRSAALIMEPWVPALPETGHFDTRGQWQRFYWREGVQVLYWKAMPDNQGYLLLEMERSAMLSELISALGQAPIPSGGEDVHSVALLDESAETFLVWGHAGDKPGLPLSSTHVESRVALSGALQAWQFVWSSPLSAVPGTADYRLILGLFLGLLVAASAVLTLVLLRRLDRDIEEAGQRVSFVNQVSHELKTPLTNIRLYAELLEQNYSGREQDAQEKKYLGIILRESARLSRLIHNVLTFARSRNGADNAKVHASSQKASTGTSAAALQMAGPTSGPATGPVAGPMLHPRLQSPDALVDSCLEGFRVSFAEKGMALELDLQCPGALFMDGDIFEQILGNFLSNAEKYARQGAWVGISTRALDAAVEVDVCDRGPGLPVAAVSRAFQPFQRFHTRHTDAVGGAGLGLAIARDLARQHGGDAEYHPNPGGGACFRFTIRSIGEGETPS